MWASVRSTWLAVGPGRDSLLLGSQNNTTVLPATLALLWSSSLVDLSSRCPLGSIQSHLALEGCLWSLACQSISLGNKANSLRGPRVLPGIPSCFSPRLSFYMFGLSCQIFDQQLRLSNESRREIPLVHFCESLLCWLFTLSLLAWHFSWRRRQTVLCPLFIWAKSKQHPQIFTGSTLFNIQATLQTSERRSLAHLGTQLLNQNICLVSCSRAHSQKLPRAFVIHFSKPHFSSCSRDVNLHCPFMHETANICPSFNTLWPWLMYPIGSNCLLATLAIKYFKHEKY